MYSRKCGAYTIIEILMIIVITGILLAIAVPNFARARESSRQRACVANLKQIYSANQQWAVDNRVSTSGVAPPSISSMVGFNNYMVFTPSCPANGTYSQPTDVAGNPTCSYGTTGGTQYNHNIDAL